MITNVSLKHADGNFKEAQLATLIEQNKIYESKGGTTISIINGNLLFFYTDHISKGVEVVEAVSLYKEYPKGTVLTITQTETYI